MKFTVSKSDFLPALAKLVKVAESKTTIPVLGNVMIVTNPDGTLSLSANNLDLALTTRCPAEIPVMGAICLPAKKLHDIFRSLTDGEAQISVEGDQATIKAGRSRFKIMGLSKDNFPELPSVPDDLQLIPALALHTALSPVAFAIATEESRYVLNAVRLEVHADKLRAVATDGHRLALIDVAGEFTQTGDVLIPRKTALELISLLAAEPESVAFAHDANRLYFRIGSDTLTSARSTGQFPDYTLVIPKSHPHTATIEAGTFLAALKRITLMADTRSHSVQVSLDDGNLTVFAESAEAGSAEESFPIEYSGPALKFAFNAGYVADFLGRVDEQVKLEIKDGQSALMLKPTGTQGYGYTLMPMRI